MPTYVYRREDGTTFELEQRISEPALTTDPATGQPVQRVITGAGLVFKGSGFYLTDYARKGAPEKPGGTPAKAEGAGSEAKPATKPAAKENAPAAPASGTPSSSKD